MKGNFYLNSICAFLGEFIQVYLSQEKFLSGNLEFTIHAIKEKSYYKFVDASMIMSNNNKIGNKALAIKMLKGKN